MSCKCEKWTELIFTGIFCAYKNKKFNNIALCATAFNFIWVLHLHETVLRKSRTHVYFESDLESVNTYFFFFTKGMIVHGYHQFLKHEQKEWYAFIVICVCSNMKPCTVMTLKKRGEIILVLNEIGATRLMVLTSYNQVHCSTNSKRCAARDTQSEQLYSLGLPAP